MPATTAARIAGLFEKCRNERRKAFIGYITGGDPSPDQTVVLLRALEHGGTDLIELGVPFSDPIADGPVIQRASDRSLRSGTNLSDLLKAVREFRKVSQTPIILFSYLNPLLRYGFEKLAVDAAAAGIDGVLLTDLSVEEAADPVHQLRRAGLDTIFLAAPTSSERRLKLIAEHSSGFIYLVSRTGVTGEQQSVSDSVKPLVDRMLRLTDLPLAVGFGISTAEQVRQVAAVSDAVVVGSALVRIIEQNAGKRDLADKLQQFTQYLSSPLRSK